MASQTIPRLTASSRQQKELISRPLAHSRRRDKPQLSCDQCRRRKSRCDRQRPCSCCTTRGQLCTYPEGSAPMGPPQPLSGTSTAHDRIVRLEHLVMSMMQSSTMKPDVDRTPDAGRQSMPGPATPAHTIPIEASADEHSDCGSLRISDLELRYVGGDHWVAILDGIADLKDHIDRDEQLRLAGDYNAIGDEVDSADPLASPQDRGALLLYGCRHAASRDEILSALPPKYAVDRYVSHYFNYLDLVSSATVHGPSFLREYGAFWANPSSVPVMWIGLLFSMICLACLASDPPGDLEVEQHSLQVDLYREKVVQCLFMGEYTKSGPYVLETVINYVYIEFGTRTDADKDMWFLLALEVNLAKRMGYHRDPSHFPGISPFRGEMRRRLWATVLMSDILLSNQMGMPRMISDWQYDTSEPRNLDDTNFDEDTQELPQSRPESELTTALGIVARTRMLKALGTIADLTSAAKACSYTEVMRVDGILHEAVQSIPTPLKMKPMAASLTDSPQAIVSRLFIQHMFYKGQVMLHRRFVFTQASESDESHNYSLNTCVNASLGSLEIQHILDEETRPGGQLHVMRWRVTSIMNHQFLTATMLLCSILHHEQTIEREAEIRAGLQRARAIWLRRSSISKEARKAAEAVSLVLARGKPTETCAKRDGPHDMVTGLDLGRPAVSPETANLNEDRLMPDFLGTYMPSGLQDPDLGVDMNIYGDLPDGWMMFVNWPGTG
ncbi:fungal-specific transcription factor domain-containing protein [Aspergillus pseudodeflectus]|uniref:Fungal-specific transcription factor domain-containing protein n=1 Tax=Aspergillus pseudodeflectus TaxID=176178 RepID=A0ABR4KK58_9EURO